MGYTFSYGAGSSDVYVVRTDASGSVLWQKTFGAGLNEIGHSIVETNDGGFMICGEAESFGAGNRDVYVLKIKSARVLWSGLKPMVVRIMKPDYQLLSLLI